MKRRFTKNILKTDRLWLLLPVLLATFLHAKLIDLCAMEISMSW